MVIKIKLPFADWRYVAISVAISVMAKTLHFAEVRGWFVTCHKCMKFKFAWVLLCVTVTNRLRLCMFIK